MNTITVTLSQKDIEYFLFILVRVASFISVAPIFNMSNVPVRTKLGLSIFLSYILYKTMPIQAIEYNTVVEYAIIIVKESLVGIGIGFSAHLCESVIVLSGRLIDTDIGLGMASVFDPVNNTESSITSTMYYYLIFAMLLLSGMDQYFIRSISDTFVLIPINTAVLPADLDTTIIKFITDYFVIAFRIILPVFAAILLLNIILGFLAKVAPQMNMFVVGIQLKLLCGFGILYLTIGLLPKISNFISEEMKRMMVMVIEGIR